MTRGQEFLERLQEGFVVGDGANAHCLQQLSCSLDQGSSVLNLSHAHLVSQVHDEYVEAGAELIETNTFDANAIRLGRHGLEGKIREINLRGAELALKSAGKRAWVSGSIGPLGLTLDDDWDMDTYYDSFRQQISLLLEGGVHVIQFETFTNLPELRLAVKVAKQLCGTDVPVIAQALYNDGGCMDSGQSAAQVAEDLIRNGADVVGVNCGRGVRVTVNAAKSLVQACGQTPVSAYPNAGFPEESDGQIVYVASPKYVGDTAALMARMGVRLIGGCCGTTPEAIRAVAVALCTVRPQPLRGGAGGKAPAAKAPPPPMALPKSGALLDSFRYVHPIIAEIDPPAHLQVQATLDDVRTVVEAGADAISLAENPLASLKVGNIAMAALIHREIETQTICHVTCRDRNLLGLQSALTGAHLLGVRGILAVTGDPVPRHEGGGLGRGVFDVHSPGLVRLVSQLNRGTTSTGKSLKEETEFSIGVAFNSAASASSRWSRPGPPCTSTTRCRGSRSPRRCSSSSTPARTPRTSAGSGSSTPGSSSMT
jgi:homocysteine S-methyltransferase